MRNFTKAFLMLLLCTLSVLTTQAKTEKVHATFESPSNTNTSWDAGTKTFTWSTTYYNQLRNIGLPSGDITKYKKLVVDCTIKSGDQFRILIYKGGSNLTLYAKDGVNEFILADTLKALYPNDYNEYLLACDEICLSGNNAAAPGEAVINDMYLETYDDEGEKVYATFESPSNTNTSWDAGTKTFTWSTTYYNQLRNIGLPSGDITKYKKLVVDCTIKSGDQFRVLIYKGGSNLTLYAKNGVNEFILADTLKALYPNDYNEYLLACDEICLSGNNAAAPGEAVINAVYLETYPENESVEIPEIQYEEDPGKPEGDFVDFIEVFSTLQPRIGLGEDTHPIVLGNGDVVVGQRTKDIIADLSAYSKLTMVTSPNLKLVVYMNHEVDAQQNAGDYAPADSGKYVFLNVQADENGIAEVDLTQYTKQDLNCICLPWDNNNKGTVWYLLLTKKADTPAAAEDVLPIDIQFGANYNDKGVQNYTSTWTATKDGKTWTIVNFNNNNNGWNLIKCGSKNNESVASITSPAINAEVKAYTISLTAAANVNSAKLTMMNGEEKVGEDIDITESFVAGEVVVPVEGQKGYSYVLTINNAKGSGNGSVQISKITLSGEVKEPVHIANTAETAYTVAKAIELIDAGEALSETVFVKGIVSQVDSYSDEYKNITYWISEDGKTEGAQFECFRGKGIDGADFASINEVEVGAEVIVKGTMKKYTPAEGDPIYEFNQNNELVTYKAPFHAPIADGKYYVYNVGAKKYLAGGSSWGTHAVVNETGVDYGFALADGKYTMDSQISNGGNNHFLNGEWNDGPAMGWTIAAVEGKEGVYTISNGTNFLTAQDNGEVTLAADATAAAAQWTLKTLEARIAELATATAEAPVNATFLIQDANFGRNDLRKSAWKMEASNQNLSGGNNINNNAESYHAVFTLSQTLSNAPAGKYKMTAQGFYRQDGEDNENLPVFYANDKTATFPLKTGSEGSMSDASASFTAGQYTIEPIEVTVFEDGQLTVGAKLATNTNLWCIFDNFVLSYVSKDIPADEFAPAYAAALEAAQAALANDDYAAVTGEEKTALEKAISDFATIPNTTDSVKLAISTLSAATTTFTTAKAAYEGLTAAKAEKAAMSFAYATAEKKAAAEATLTVEATSAADAVAKTEAIAKAYRQYAESNAMLEGVEGATNVTDSITNPAAEAAVAAPWKVVLGEGSGGSIDVKNGEPWTDGDDNATHKYFDGGNWGAQAWNVALEQKIALPAGKYLLTVKGRASADVDLRLFAGADTVKMSSIGAAGGLFNRGWNDASVEFEMAEADSIVIGVRGVTNMQYNWMSFSDFRLVKFPTAEDIALGNAIDALKAIIAAAKAIETEGKNGADALNAAITPAETALNAADATIESLAAAKEALAQAISVFNKANLDADLIEIAQSQGKDLDTFTRTDLVEGAGYNTYTANGDLNIAIKMMNVDVKDCDYVVIKFAEPVAAGWHLAFWSNQDLVDVPEGATEFTYVFANDPKCGVSAEGVLPQICMMTFFGGYQAPLVAKIEGIYKHQIPVEIAHTWDFTKWSEATIANLKAEAAKGYTEGLWSDSEKADGSASTMEISKDNCFWQVGTSAAEGETLTANGEEIAELKGLIFKNNKARSLAIAVNYGDCTSANGEGFGPYHGGAYLWLGSKNIEYFTIPAVKGGTTIKMGVESHKLAEARGVQLFAGETELKDADGNAVAAPKTYTEQSWVVPAGVAFDIVVKNTNGCHIYFIDAEQDEDTLTAISTLKSNDRLNGTIYNLNGQKMNKAQRGLYIINGKKVVIK